MRPGFAQALAGAMALVTAAALAFPEGFERPALYAWGCGSAALLMVIRWACLAAASEPHTEDNSL